jgi:hypothetical protein
VTQDRDLCAEELLGQNQHQLPVAAMARLTLADKVNILLFGNRDQTLELA